MSDWASSKEVAAALNMTPRAVQIRAVREGWRWRKKPGSRCGRLWAIGDVPARARAELAARAANEAVAQSRADGADGYVRREAVRAAVDGRTRQRVGEKGLARLAQLRGRELARAEARLTLLEACAEFERRSRLPKTQALTAFCAAWNGGKIEAVPEIRNEIGQAYPTLIYRWRATTRAEGLARLAGAYGNRKGSGLIDSQPDLFRFVVAMLTDHPSTSGKNMRRAMVARFGERGGVKLPSVASVQRWVKTYRRDNAELVTALANPDAWKNTYMLAFGAADEDVKRLNQRWETDATPADVELIDGRYHIMALVDVFSRRAKLRVTKTSTAQATCCILRDGLLDWGMFETLKTDNGSEVINQRVQRVMDALIGEQERCNVFSGWEKPFVERLFQTFLHGLVELMPNYIGHNVAERSAIEARKSFAERIMTKNEVVKINMTAADLQEFCDRWLANIYHVETHSGLGTSPSLKAAGQPCRRIENTRALDLLLVDGGERTVAKKGIRIDSIFYIAPELDCSGARIRYLHDPDDFGRIYVFDAAGEFLCIAESEFTGLARQEVAAVARERQKARVQTARRELKAAARKQKTRDIAEEILAERGRAADASNVTPFPGPATPYDSPGLSAAADAAAARDALDAEPMPKPVSAEALARVAGMLRDEQGKDETAEDRFRRWIKLDRARARGEQLCETDAAWARMYEPLPECSGRRLIYDEFGASPFGVAEQEDAPAVTSASVAST